MTTVRTELPHGVVMGALEQALRAPSVHNTQPWKWRIADDTVALHADATRHLIGTDPDQRDLVISCGAALHHLRAALAAAGVPTAIERTPDPEDSGLLAVVRMQPGLPDPRDVALAAAIDMRRTDRRALIAPPQPAQLRRLVALAARYGARLHPVLGAVARARLGAVLGEAAARQRHTPGYPAELAIWTRRYADARDGVPAELRTYQPAAHDLRPFPPGRLTPAPRPSAPRAADVAAPADLDALVVLTTDADTVTDRLRAGEALSAVLLDATALGLASTPLSQAVEIEHTRQQLAQALPGMPGHPQLVVRLGRSAAGAAELPATPRRPLSWVLLPAR